MANMDGIPISVRAPADGTTDKPVALWIPWLSGTKESVVAALDMLAARGFVAMSFDPWQHGSRASETKEQLTQRVFSDFRRYFWSILGHSVIDGLRVLDRAVTEMKAAPRFFIGGVSMGGDIALSLAGIEPRVERVAVIAATPDWMRPGMTALEDPKKHVNQGVPDAPSKWFYEQLDPMTHLTRFDGRPAIAFECGTNDDHVPCEAAERFRVGIANLNPSRSETIRITTHPDLDHLALSRSRDVTARCIDFLSEGVE